MRYLLLAALLLTALACNSSAETVRVVTRDIEPFSFEKDGRRTGFAIDLWDQVARELQITSELSTVGTANEMVEAVQSKAAEVAVGALSITSERETLIDFSQPFYETGLQIAVSSGGGGLAASLWALISGLFTWRLMGGLALAVGVMLLVSHLVWLYEHPVNEEMWPRSYLAGLGESLWWTLSIFLVGGADNKGPIGLGGRIVATIWMLASVVAVSLLTASLSATLTVSSLTSEIRGPSDLPGRKVATISGSTSEAWLQEVGSDGGLKVTVATFSNIPDCLGALKSGAVQAVVFDSSILRYYVSQEGGDTLMLVGPLFEKSAYGFGLQPGSPLRERINRGLLVLKERGAVEELRRKWFGTEG
jgi:polar amino acid transport system substrate-binding protein